MIGLIFQTQTIIKYDKVCPSIYSIHPSIHPNPVWSSMQKDNMEPVHCGVIMKFDLHILTFTLRILSGIIVQLINYTCQLLHIFREYQPNMKPLHCGVILTIDFEIWLFLPWKSYLGLCSNIIHDNCFIFSWQIKRSWYLSTVRIFLLLTLKLWPWPWKCCLGHSSETINSNNFIFYGRINLILGPVHCWVILTFVFEIMTIVFKILFINSCLAQPRGIQCHCYIYFFDNCSWQIKNKH